MDGLFEGLGDRAGSAFRSITETLCEAAGSVSTTIGGWLGLGEDGPAKAPSEPSLWDRIGEGIGDLGRGLSEEGLGGLLHPGELIDRQRARRAQAGPGAAPEAPVGGGVDEAVVEEIAPGQSDHVRHDGRTPVARDPSASGAWRRGADGTWKEEGQAGPRARTEFELSDSMYRGEHRRYFQSGADRTKYYDEGERAAHRLAAASDGRVRGANGAALETRDAAAGLTFGGFGGSHIFAADRSGIFSADAGAENAAMVAKVSAGGVNEPVHHSSFTGGGDVHAAGEVIAHDGWLKMVSNNSGHYKPDARGNVQAVEALDAMGVNTDAAIVHQKAVLEGDVETHNYYNARAFAASGGNEELLQTHKDMFSQMRGAAGKLRAGKLDGMIPRETIQEARGADAAELPLLKRANARASLAPSAAAKRASADRADAQEAPPATKLPVEQLKVAAEDQAESGASGKDFAEASPVEARGAGLSGWAAGTWSAAERHLKKEEDQAAAEKRKGEAAAPAASRAPTAAATAPPQAPLYDLAQLAPPAPPQAPLYDLSQLAPPAPPQAPLYDLSQLAPPAPLYDLSQLASPAPPQAQAPLYDLSQLASPAPLYDTSQLAPPAPLPAVPQPDTAEAKAARKAAKAAAWEAEEKAAAEARVAARVNGDHLGLHDAPISPSRTDVLKGGWRRQEAELVPSPGESQRRAWRREAGAEAPAAEPAPKFQIDPRKTGHYAGEFESYMAGAADMLPEGIHQRTKRYDGDELAQRALKSSEGVEVDPRTGRTHVQSGLLTRGSGEVMDTTAASATKLEGTDAGRNIFALDGHDVRSDHGSEHRQTLYAADTRKERDENLAAALAANASGEAAALEHVHHSSFNGGRALEGAGDIAVKQGFVQRISNHSGHYEPDARSNFQTLRAMERMGVNLDATTVENKVVDGRDVLQTETYQARAMLESGNNLALLRRHKDLFAQVRGRGETPASAEGTAAAEAPAAGPGTHSAALAAPKGSFDAWRDTTLAAPAPAAAPAPPAPARAARVEDEEGPPAAFPSWNEDPHTVRTPAYQGERSVAEDRMLLAPRPWNKNHAANMRAMYGAD